MSHGRVLAQYCSAKASPISPVISFLDTAVLAAAGPDVRKQRGRAWQRLLCHSMGMAAAATVALGSWAWAIGARQCLWWSRVHLCRMQGTTAGSQMQGLLEHCQPLGSTSGRAHRVTGVQNRGVTSFHGVKDLHAGLQALDHGIHRQLQVLVRSLALHHPKGSRPAPTRGWRRFCRVLQARDRVAVYRPGPGVSLRDGLRSCHSDAMQPGGRVPTMSMWTHCVGGSLAARDTTGPADPHQGTLLAPPKHASETGALRPPLSSGHDSGARAFGQCRGLMTARLTRPSRGPQRW